ncbi:hypothetical protein LCGC14_0146130 [marine sediment metagenome]|uniref:Uncharacterized protein n=1 Tax=marine sediment metagenome TaxID=412755 RepID=A0A0F9VFD3_9ZZZZ
MELTSDLVQETMKYCLYNDDEVIDGKTPDEAVLVDGITTKFGFHPGRLEEKASVIIDMLGQLPESFQEAGGGGMSFINACQDKNGRQWTDFHRIMEELFCLGEAIGKVSQPMPKEMWKVLPGGMPYYIVLTERATGEAVPV